MHSYRGGGGGGSDRTSTGVSRGRVHRTTSAGRKGRVRQDQHGSQPRPGPPYHFCGEEGEGQRGPARESAEAGSTVPLLRGGGGRVRQGQHGSQPRPGPPYPRLEFWPFSGPFRVQKIIFSFRKIFSQYSVPYRTRNPWHSEH